MKDVSATKSLGATALRIAAALLCAIAIAAGLCAWNAAVPRVSSAYAEEPSSSAADSADVPDSDEPSEPAGKPSSDDEPNSAGETGSGSASSSGSASGSAGAQSPGNEQGSGSSQGSNGSQNTGTAQDGNSEQNSADNPPAASTSTDLLGIELYAATTDANGKWLEMIDRKNKGTNAAPEYWLKGGIKDKGGQVRLLLEAYWSDGTAFWQYEEAWRQLDVTYDTSDRNVATVSSTGIVTATGDGQARLSVIATDKNGNSWTAELWVSVSGQTGALVTEVYVCDEAGNQYENERITYKQADFKLELFARVVLSDGTHMSNAPGAEDYDPSALEAATELSWSVSDTDCASVNATTGVVRAQALGQTKVYVTATGGDPENKLGGKVRSYVWVVIDDGKYGRADSLPASDLTVEVVYDLYPDYVVWTKTYSLDEVKALAAPVYCTYTFTRSEGAYVTASGVGVYLTTLIDLTPININQIESFTFTANDGANPGKMSYDYLFNECYYWPLYELGGNTSGGQLVFPMLAWASDWRDSSAGITETSEDYEDLNEGTRFRLLFGSKTKSDGRTDHSLKYISKVTIRISGAPDSTHGDADDGNGDGDNPGKDTNDDGWETVPAGDGDGGESGGGDSGGSGGESTGNQGSDEGTSGKSASKNGKDADKLAGVKANSSAETPEAASSPSAQQPSQTSANNDASSSKASSEEPASQGGATDDLSSKAQRWKVYQMINNLDDAKLAITELDDNPLAPFALPAVLALFALGAVRSGFSFRRQLL